MSMINCKFSFVKICIIQELYILLQMTLKLTYQSEKQQNLFLLFYVEMCSLRRTLAVNKFTDKVKGGLKGRVMTY